MKLLKKLIGNDLFKHYSSEKNPFMKCGFNGVWNVYNATHKERKTPVCIFVAEKKNLKNVSKSSKKEIFTELKRSATSLAKFKHPNILGIVEQVAEDKSCIGFVTERVTHTLTSWVESVHPTKLEIKSVFIELCKALIFLHEDAHCVHNNLTPDTIFIDDNNKIKLGCFEFSINDPQTAGEEFKPESLLQNFSFLAPEIVLDNKAFYLSDVFSLGTILYYLLKCYKNEKVKNYLSLSSNDHDGFKKAYDIVKSTYNDYGFDFEDNKLLSRMIGLQKENRAVMKDIIEDTWFSDPKLKALHFIEHLENNEQSKNVEFLQKLPSIIEMFEQKIISQRFLPSLMKGLKMESLTSYCLPPIIAIAENENLKIDFNKEIWPNIKVLFSLKSMSGQCLYFLLSKIKFISSKISNTEFASSFLNVVCKALDCNVVKIQAVVADNMMIISSKIDSMSFKNQIYPRIIQILLNTNSKSLKVNLLGSLKSLHKMLNQNIINDNLLTNLEKIRKSDNSAEICMLIASIYEEIAKIVSVQSIAGKILPNLISILVSGNISRGNFDTLMELVHKYLDRIKQDREKDLFDDKKTDGIEDTQKLSTEKPDTKATISDSDFLSAFFSDKPSTKKPTLNQTNTFNVKLPKNEDLPKMPQITKTPTTISPVQFDFSKKEDNFLKQPNTNTGAQNAPISFNLTEDLNAGSQLGRFSNTNPSTNLNIGMPSTSPGNPFNFNPTNQNVMPQSKPSVTLDNLLNDLGDLGGKNQGASGGVNMNTNMNTNVNTNINTNMGSVGNQGGFDQMDLNFLSTGKSNSNPNEGFQTNFGQSNLGGNNQFGFDFTSSNTMNQQGTQNPFGNVVRNSNPTSNQQFNFDFTSGGNMNNQNKNNNNNNNLFNF